jgi:tRNA(fMet)-specific endonuclease VapC
MVNRYMLDTNACIALIKSRPEAMRIRFSGLLTDEVGVSSIVAAELWYGVALSQKKRQNEAALRDFLDYVAATRANPDLSIYTFIDRPL